MVGPDDLCHLVNEQMNDVIFQLQKEQSCGLENSCKYRPQIYK